MNVGVIVAVDVSDAVIVAALVNGNETVGVIDAVDDPTWPISFRLAAQSIRRTSLKAAAGGSDALERILAIL